MRAVIPDRIFEGRVNREDANQAGDVEKARDRAFANREPDFAAVFERAAMRADQRTEAGRIEKLKLREIDDEVVFAFAPRLPSALPEPTVT